MTKTFAERVEHIKASLFNGAASNFPSMSDDVRMALEERCEQTAREVAVLQDELQKRLDANVATYSKEVTAAVASVGDKQQVLAELCQALGVDKNSPNQTQNLAIAAAQAIVAARQAAAQRQQDQARHASEMERELLGRLHKAEVHLATFPFTLHTQPEQIQQDLDANRKLAQNILSGIFNMPTLDDTSP